MRIPTERRDSITPFDTEVGEPTSQLLGAGAYGPPVAVVDRALDRAGDNLLVRVDGARMLARCFVMMSRTWSMNGPASTEGSSHSSVAACSTRPSRWERSEKKSFTCVFFQYPSTTKT